MTPILIAALLLDAVLSLLAGGGLGGLLPNLLGDEISINPYANSDFPDRGYSGMPNNSFDVKTGKVLVRGAHGIYCGPKNQRMGAALGTVLFFGWYGTKFRAYLPMDTKSCSLARYSLLSCILASHFFPISSRMVPKHSNYYYSALSNFKTNLLPVGRAV